MWQRETNSQLLSQLKWFARIDIVYCSEPNISHVKIVRTHLCEFLLDYNQAGIYILWLQEKIFPDLLDVCTSFSLFVCDRYVVHGDRPIAFLDVRDSHLHRQGHVFDIRDRFQYELQIFQGVRWSLQVFTHRLREERYGFYSVLMEIWILYLERGKPGMIRIIKHVLTELHKCTIKKYNCSRVGFISTFHLSCFWCFCQCIFNTVTFYTKISSHECTKCQTWQHLIANKLVLFKKGVENDCDRQ